MGLFAIFVHYLMNKGKIQSRTGSLLVFSFAVSVVGGLLQSDFLLQGMPSLNHIGFLIQFMSTEMQEVAITTLTANAAPAELYHNRLKPSFLLTFSGTLGRTFGCLQMTFSSWIIGSDNDYRLLIDTVYAPLVVVYGVQLLISTIFFKNISGPNENRQQHMYIHRK